MTGVELCGKLSSAGLRVLGDEAQNVAVPIIDVLGSTDPQAAQAVRNAVFDLLDHPTSTGTVCKAVGVIEKAIPIMEARFKQVGAPKGWASPKIWERQRDQYLGRLDELEDAVKWARIAPSAVAVGGMVTGATLLGAFAGLLISRR